MTGTGEDYFSAGLLNPEIRAGLDKEEVVAFVLEANRVFDSIESLPQTVIAAINGTIMAGAVELALPVELVQRLKLKEVGSIRAFTADGGRYEFRLFGIAEVEVQERTCQARVIELPHGAKPLLGAIPLEQMDWHVSPQAKKLVPNPESPDGPLVPMC